MSSIFNNKVLVTVPNGRQLGGTLDEIKTRKGTFTEVNAGGVTIAAGKVGGVNISTLESTVNAAAGSLSSINNILTDPVKDSLANLPPDPITADQWDYISYMDQYVDSQSNVEFIDVKLTGLTSDPDSAVKKSYVDSVAQGMNYIAPVINLQNTAPGAPTVNDSYIVGPAPTGVWTGYSDYIAVWSLPDNPDDFPVPTWNFRAPVHGSTTFVKTSGTLYHYNGSDWIQISGTISHQGLINLQGGGTNERYHLTSAQHTNLTGGTPAFMSLTTTNSISTSGGLRLNDTVLYLRTGNDTNHGLRWISGTETIDTRTGNDGLYGWGYNAVLFGTKAAGDKIGIKIDTNNDVTIYRNALIQGGISVAGGVTLSGGVVLGTSVSLTSQNIPGSLIYRDGTFQGLDGNGQWVDLGAASTPYTLPADITVDSIAARTGAVVTFNHPITTSHSITTSGVLAGSGGIEARKILYGSSSTAQWRQSTYTLRFGMAGQIDPIGVTNISHSESVDGTFIDFNFITPYVDDASIPLIVQASKSATGGLGIMTELETFVRYDYARVRLYYFNAATGLRTQMTWPDLRTRLTADSAEFFIRINVFGPVA